MVIRPYDDSLAEDWDAFVRQAASGTLLHTRRFLSYHQDRFEDRSLLVLDEKENIQAVFPAALAPSDRSVVVSHPGISYGGLLGHSDCRGESMVRAMQAVCDYFAVQGATRILYKAVPYFYHRTPAQDDLYALFRLGAERYRCDLSATIDLNNRGRIGSRRKRGYKKAVKAGVQIADGKDYAGSLWDVLSSNLQAKHDTKPVHSLEEILLLYDRFPEEIQFVVALCYDKVEAGVVLFNTPMTSHSQYIASSDNGYAVNALDMLFGHCIEQAKERGARYFDFGISNEDGGRSLNEGLYGFKSEFGSGGCVHEFYQIELGAEP